MKKQIIIGHLSQLGDSCMSRMINTISDDALRKTYMQINQQLVEIQPPAAKKYEIFQW